MSTIYSPWGSQNATFRQMTSAPLVKYLNKSQNIFNNWKVLRHGLLPSLILLTTSTLQCNADFFTTPGQVSLRALALAIPTAWNTCPLNTSRAHSVTFIFLFNLSLLGGICSSSFSQCYLSSLPAVVKQQPPPSIPASFSLMGAQSLSHVRLFAASWTVACQTLLSMEFSRQEYWNGLPFPSLGDLPDPGIKPASLVSPAMAGGFLTTAPPAKSPFSLTGGLIFLHGAHSVLQLFICPSQFSEGTLFCSPLHPQHLEQFWHTVGTQVLSNACTAGRNRELTNIFRN